MSAAFRRLASALPFTAFLALVLLAGPALPQGQPGRVYRVGVLGTTTRVGNQPYLDAMLEGLRTLGYVEGRNLLLEYRYAEGKLERLPALAAELVRLNVDLLLVSSNPVIAAARQATEVVPIVMTTGFEPVRWGFAQTLARPGGNVTGLTIDVNPETDGKRVELLKEMVPHVARIAVLRDPGFPGQEPYLKAIEQAARSLRVSVHLVDVTRPEGLDAAFASIADRGVGAVWVGRQPLLLAHRTRVVELAARHRLPALYGFREFVEAGGLISYGANIRDLFRRSAAYIDKILRGAKPAELPIEQPTRFELVINLKTAQTLGLTVPASLLVRADEVIR